MTEHRIILGDSRSLHLLPDRSVQLIITSPPYWQLKDYGTENQIGFHDSYETYINNLNLVWQECERVLANGCRLCINIGDQFARSVYYGRYKVIPIRTEIIRFCETLGMDYMGAIIWQKTTTMNTSGGGAIMGSFPYPRNGILKMDYEFILLFKKLGNPPKPTPEQKAAAAMSKEDWGQYFSSHWHFAGVKQRGHIAMFPEELPKRLIRMFSFPGETVLDPFAGSGTTSLAAAHLGRNSIGYEINREYVPFIREKLQPEGDDWQVHFVEDNQNAVHTFDRLPYLFQDPHRIQRTTDFVEHPYRPREDLVTVKQVLSPEQIQLGDGRVVGLLGVTAIPEHAEEAVLYLEKKFRKRRVFLKTDPAIDEAERESLCYLYLDNKTFVNNHLVRTGLVAVDTQRDYRFKKKFLASLPDKTVTLLPPQ